MIFHFYLASNQYIVFGENVEVSLSNERLEKGS